MLFNNKGMGRCWYIVYFFGSEVISAMRSGQRFRQGLTPWRLFKRLQQPIAATKERPPIDNSYDISLLVMLDDMAAHDAYQVDPIHLDFIEQFSSFWTKVQIYDAD